MDPEPLSQYIGTALWLPGADSHGVRYFGGGKSFDEVAQDHCVSGEAHHELLATDRMGTTSAAHEAFARTTKARTQVTDEAIGRPGGDLECHVDPVQVLDPEGQIVPRRLAPDAGGAWESIAAPGRGPPIGYAAEGPRGYGRERPRTPAP